MQNVTFINTTNGLIVNAAVYPGEKIQVVRGVYKTPCKSLSVVEMFTGKKTNARKGETIWLEDYITCDFQKIEQESFGLRENLSNDQKQQVGEYVSSNFFSTDGQTIVVEQVTQALTLLENNKFEFQPASMFFAVKVFDSIREVHRYKVLPNPKRLEAPELETVIDAFGYREEMEESGIPFPACKVISFEVFKNGLPPLTGDWELMGKVHMEALLKHSDRFTVEFNLDDLKQEDGLDEIAGLFYLAEDDATTLTETK